MGGRLDATNALDTDCALIVSIDLDHREWLGETRDAIGREKAGIVRRGKPVVIGDRAVPRSVLAHVGEQSAMPHLIGRDFDFRRDGSRLAQGARRRYARRRCRCRRSAATSNSRTPPRARPSSMRSPPLCPSATPRSRPESRTRILRGRLERHDVDGVEWVFDVGHNPAAADGARSIVAAACRRPRARGSCSPRCATRISRASCNRSLRRLRAGSSRKRARIAARRAPSSGLCSRVSARSACHVADDVAAACAAARAAAASGDRVVVYGSFHTVGAATRSASAILRTLPIG